MKKINFELIFKIIVLIQLTIILLLLLFPSNDSEEINDSNENGRYKEVKTKRASSYGKDMGEL
jgi:competence protein ComGC